MSLLKFFSLLFSVMWTGMASFMMWTIWVCVTWQSIFIMAMVSLWFSALELELTTAGSNRDIRGLLAWVKRKIKKMFFKNVFLPLCGS